MNRYEDIQEYVASMTEGHSYRDVYQRLLLEDPDLYRKYCERFPNQADCKINMAEIHAFMKENEQRLLEIGRTERKIYAAYLKKIYIPGDKCAVVDLGWRCSMLKGLQEICEKEDIACCFYGYYLGTHPFNAKGLRAVAYGINQGNPTNGILSAMNQLYCVDILELIFSAPHPSTLKLREEDGGILPVYQSTSSNEARRNKITAEIIEGIADFSLDYLGIIGELPISISAETALAPAYYFVSGVSKTDLAELEKVRVFPGVGDDNTCFPLTPNGRGRIALINPWPSVQCAESEALIRIQDCGRAMGFDVVITDYQGFRLDENQVPTGVKYEGSALDFAISFNHETPKLLDCFYYHTLWSPPEISLRLEYYTERLSKNLIMNDDYLSYWNGPMKSHIQSICMNKPRDLSHASSLTASFPKRVILKPDLSNPKIFYCGMNWELVDGNSVRHGNLFQRLDRTGVAEFYGPESVSAWGGIRPWEGYRCYKGSIPFDGFSILKKINQCGICLALSSDVHRRSAAATNRVYEACAAGAIMISDNNEFVKHHFRDTVLYIDYNVNDPQDTYVQIMERYEWIVQHPKEAIAMAERAQQIFLEKFALDRQLQMIINRHGQRKEQIAKDLYAHSTEGKVLVAYILDTQYEPHIEKYLGRITGNICNQIYSNIELVIAVDNMVFDYVQHYCETKCAATRVIPMPLFDRKYAKQMTDGQALIEILKNSCFDYFIITNAREIWFQDHITTLVRSIEDSTAVGAYSGTLLEDEQRNRSVFFFGRATTKSLYEEMSGSQRFPVPGQFLFCAEACGFLPDFLFDCLDGKEYYAYANILQYKIGKKIVFSNRMTMAFYSNRQDLRDILISDDKQTRFIQDLVQYDLPEQAVIPMSVPASTTVQPIVNDITGKRMLGKALLLLPIKNYIRLRYYRFRMRRAAPESKKYKMLEEKYTAILKQYDEFWGA